MGNSSFSRPLGIALALNTAVLAFEMIASIGANSLTLGMEAVHNFSDEIALFLIFVAYRRGKALSGRLLGIANFMNTTGLLVITGLLTWHSVERLFTPQPVLGEVFIAAGLAAALGNWGVALALKKASRGEKAIRLAYVHNLSDVAVSLAPVAAGVVVLATGNPVFDPLIALMLGAWIMVMTFKTLFATGETLVPETENVKA